jgi:hypothetical protein
LGKSVTALANFKVDPAVSVSAQEIVFLDELVQDVRELDVNIFWIRHRSRGGIDKNLRKIICPKINFEVWKL